MDSKTLGKINKYKEKKLLLDDESRLIYIKINKLNNKIDLQEKERQLENEKREKRENESSICSVM